MAVVGVAVSAHGRHASKPAFDEIHAILNVLGVGLAEGCFVEITLIEPCGVDVEGLFVNLRGIQASGENERCIHLAATVGGQNVPAEIEQTVHQQHDGVFIAVTVAPLGGMEEWMSVAA